MRGVSPPQERGTGEGRVLRRPPHQGLVRGVFRTPLVRGSPLLRREGPHQGLSPEEQSPSPGALLRNREGLVRGVLRRREGLVRGRLSSGERDLVSPSLLMNTPLTSHSLLLNTGLVRGVSEEERGTGEGALSQEERGDW